MTLLDPMCSLSSKFVLSSNRLMTGRFRRGVYPETLPGHPGILHSQLPPFPTYFSFVIQIHPTVGLDWVVDNGYTSDSQHSS